MGRGRGDYSPAWAGHTEDEGQEAEVKSPVACRPRGPGWGLPEGWEGQGDVPTGGRPGRWEGRR